MLGFAAAFFVAATFLAGATFFVADVDAAVLEAGAVDADSAATIVDENAG